MTNWPHQEDSLTNSHYKFHPKKKKFSLLVVCIWELLRSIWGIWKFQKIIKERIENQELDVFVINPYPRGVFVFRQKKKKRTGKKNNQETNEPKGKAKARKEGAQKEKRNPKKKKKRSRQVGQESSKKFKFWPFKRRTKHRDNSFFAITESWKYFKISKQINT